MMQRRRLQHRGSITMFPRSSPMSIRPRFTLALIIGFIGAALAPGVPRAQETSYRVYVTNEGSGDLTVIDGPSRQVIATIALGKRPRGIAADARHQRLFVALSGSPVAGPGVDENSLPPPDKREDGIAIIDAKNNKLERVLRGSSDPEQVALSVDGERLYVASEDTGQGIAIDVATGII